MDYDDWKKTRLERVRGRCGGRPTFVGSRLQPHDVALRPWTEVESDWPSITQEDWEHARRFVKEEPHWKVLSNGLDWDGRELSDQEYAELQRQYPRMD